MVGVGAVGLLDLDVGLLVEDGIGGGAIVDGFYNTDRQRRRSEVLRRQA